MRNLLNKPFLSVKHHTPFITMLLLEIIARKTHTHKWHGFILDQLFCFIREICATVFFFCFCRYLLCLFLYLISINRGVCDDRLWLVTNVVHLQVTMCDNQKRCGRSDLVTSFIVLLAVCVLVPLIEFSSSAHTKALSLSFMGFS